MRAYGINELFLKYPPRSYLPPKPKYGIEGDEYAVGYLMIIELRNRLIFTVLTSCTIPPDSTRQNSLLSFFPLSEAG